MTGLSSDDLAAIRARADAAIEGPWEVRYGDPYMAGPTWTLRQAGKPGIRLAVSQYGFDDMAEFIAHARSDIPNLLTEVDRLQREVARLRKHTPFVAFRSDGKHCSSCGLPLEHEDHVGGIADFLRYQPVELSSEYDRCPRCLWSAISTAGICAHCGWNGTNDADQTANESEKP